MGHHQGFTVDENTEGTKNTGYTIAQAGKSFSIEKRVSPERRFLDKTLSKLWFTLSPINHFTRKCDVEKTSSLLSAQLGMQQP